MDLLKIKCFSRDTLVHTATGPRPIGEIEPGEQIWSYHFERGVWGLCEVKERLDNTYSGPVVSITVDNTTIEATAYHPFWVIEGRDLQERSKPRELQEREDEGQSLPGRWVNSHELRAGDCIITRSGTRAIITEIRQRFDDAFPVSNLSIIGHHNYAVGEVVVLVHNITVCEETIKDLSELYANGKGKSLDELRDLLRSKKDEKGNRLYNEDEINDAIGKVLAPYKVRNTTPSPALDGTPYHPDVVAGRVKPPYRANPAHDRSSPSFNPRKTPEPPDAAAVYGGAVRSGMGEWFGVGADGKIYRFFSDNAGGVHFSGIVPRTAVPKDILKQLGI